MLTVAIHIQDAYTGQYNRVDLFDDEKISVVSSIQNINDISKTYTDFSQTFTVPASNQNNKIFRHWYDNSNDNPFPTLVKSFAYIEIDTILFRKGKIQLESANIVDGQPQDYSITFIGLLGNLKDKFAGLFLKDLTSTAYDFNYSATIVKDRVTQNVPAQDVMFPLISSLNYWQYDTPHFYDIFKNSQPIRYNDLFPAIRVGRVLNMIESQFGINFNTLFEVDDKFENAYLWMKNSEAFKVNLAQLFMNNFVKISGADDISTLIGSSIIRINDFDYAYSDYNRYNFLVYAKANVAGKPFSIFVYKNDILTLTIESVTQTTFIGFPIFSTAGKTIGANQIGDYKIYVKADEVLQFEVRTDAIFGAFDSSDNLLYQSESRYESSAFLTTTSLLGIRQYFPEIKIEDFFSGILKMFNLTCFTQDGINYTIEPLDDYYNAGVDIDLTKYVIQDKKNLNRVKSYKKINFDYEKSESITNVSFNSNAGIEYGSLSYSTGNDGEEYSIKLPFENLGFQNLTGLLQVGYALKTDLKPYIPKPVILYAYKQSGTTTVPKFHFSTSTTGNGLEYTEYHAFGQETLVSGQTYSLNFNEQQSTLTNEVVFNGLYQMYYSNYFANIFNFKARLIKISTILPTSILTTLKLNDSIIIRDTKYIINTMTTDLTTGEVQFELLTDQRQ
jgi:hypothetical protein